MKKVIFILIIFCLPCKQSKQNFSDTTIQEDCINSKLVKRIDVNSEFNKIEKSLIDFNLLRYINKKNYIILFNQLNSSSNKDLIDKINKFHKDINRFITDRNVLVYTPTVINIFECNISYIDSMKIDENSTLFNYKESIQSVLKDGSFDDIHAIERIIISIPEKEFLNINFRIPLISLYLLLSETHYMIK